MATEFKHYSCRPQKHLTRIRGVLLTGAAHFLRWILLSIESQFVTNSRREVNMASFSKSDQVNQHITEFLTQVCSVSIRPPLHGGGGGGGGGALAMKTYTHSTNNVMLHVPGNPTATSPLHWLRTRFENIQYRHIYQPSYTMYFMEIVTAQLLISLVPASTPGFITCSGISNFFLHSAKKSCGVEFGNEAGY